jgi:NAD(P)-dependent dehydrogenase (short-subunit alcohol dehydrogenase family)
MSGSGLSGLTALVTGASRGIGLAVSRSLAAEGVRLVLNSRGGEALEAAAQLTGGCAVAEDVATAAGRDRLVRETKAVLEGSPDILVNNAGLFGLSPAATLAPREFDRHLDVNLRAPFHLVRAFLPDMLERGDGTLVHIGSIAGRQAFPENAAYAASKFGLRGLHEVLCLELAGTGVVSLLVEPGPVDTNAWDPLDDRLGRDLPARVQMLRPETVAAAVVSALKLVEEGARSEILVLPA